MILIADSGSTKTDWVSLDKSFQTQTKGFNPHVVNSEFISNELMNTAITGVASKVESVYFYGAGASSEPMKNVIRKGLQGVFTIATLHIEHDLLGAARATYNGKPQVSSILGTGSNSCWHNGTELQQHHPSLGYLLGDEGSGRHLGGKLLRAYLYKQLPQELTEAFLNLYEPEGKDFVTHLYRQELPNRYLASFAPFVFEHKKHPFIKNLILESFTEFAQIHLSCYQQPNLEYNFIGSIAHYFKEELTEVLEKENLSMGQVILKPIEGLVEYHKKF